MTIADRRRDGGRGLAWLLVALLASGGSGCTTMIPLRLTSPTLADEVERSREVIATLGDRTTARFDRPLVDTNRVLHGELVTCYGPSCPRVRAQEQLRLEEVRELEGRYYSKKKTAAVATSSVLGAALVVAGIVALVVAMRGLRGGFGFSGGF